MASRRLIVMVLGAAAVLGVALSACGGGGKREAATTTSSSMSSASSTTFNSSAAPSSSAATSPEALTATSSTAAAAPATGDETLNAVTSDGAVVSLDRGGVYSVNPSDQSTASSWASGATISVGANDDSLANLDTNEAVSATNVGDTATGNVYPNPGDHTQQTNSNDGSLIVLDDGSIWQVAPTDQPTTALWLDASSITVQEDSSSPPYTLVNTDDQSSVTASYIGNE